MTDTKINPKIVIVGGPTATGKTEVAVELARKFNGELINADSRQIYKHLDIGTNKGKIEGRLPAANNNSTYQRQAGKSKVEGRKTKVESREVENYFIGGIPIHLVNIIEPDERFDLFRFQKLTFEEIEDILSRGKLPIIIGGTGLYIDSIVKNYELTIKNEELGVRVGPREELEKMSVEELQGLILQTTNYRPQTLNDSDWNNPRRLIRYIEKLEAGNWKLDENQKTSSELHLPVSSFNYLFLYPEYDWIKLKEKINKRVITMFEEGLVEETKKVLKMRYREKDHGLQVMGYKEVLKYIKGEISKEKCIELVQNAHRQYARRQRTWFEGVGRGYDLSRFKNGDDAEKYVTNFVNKG